MAIGEIREETRKGKHIRTICGGRDMDMDMDMDIMHRYVKQTEKDRKKLVNARILRGDGAYRKNDWLRMRECVARM
jgi:hypothetical protein